jgi:hypothetical protein
MRTAMTKVRTAMADALVNPVASDTEAAWRAAVQFADEAALRIEGRWGIGRLERLVPPELAAKFAMAQRQLDEAISRGDPKLAAQKSASLAKGWEALDKAAREAGHRPEDAGNIWFQASEDGKRRYCFVARASEGSALARRFTDHIVVSFEEVIRLMETTEAGAAVSAVKQVFPGATLAAGRIPKGGDEIPF